MANVLICGGSSFIGLNLISSFLEKGFTVYVYGRVAPSIESEKLIFIKGELSEISVKLESLKSIRINSALYLVNTFPANGIVVDYTCLLEMNFKAISDLYKIVDRVVFFSSGGRVYKDSDSAHDESELLSPNCIYGKSKVALERFLQFNYKNRYLIIRPSNPYGRHQDFFGNQGVVAVLLGKIKSHQKLQIWGTGLEVRDYIYIEDFVERFMTLFGLEENPYDVYNIGSGVGTTTMDIVRAIDSILGSSYESQVEYLSPESKLIKFNVLSINRLESVIGKYKYTTIETGIQKFMMENFDLQDCSYGK
ncbi:NAD-dependent epimerase/dehydratase family protein [Shewanella algae]